MGRGVFLIWKCTLPIYGPLAVRRLSLPVSFKEAGMWRIWFRNYYRCTECGCEWVETCPARCERDCPFCGARKMPPLISEKLTESDDE